MTRPVFIALSLIALAASFAAGRWSTPAAETRVVTEYVERVREVRTTKIQRDTQTKWKTVVVRAKDGTTTETTVGETVSKERSDEVAENAKTSEAQKTSTAKPIDKKWQVSVYAGVNLRELGPTTQPVFGVGVGYRLLGPFTVNALAQTNGTVSAGLGLVF